VVAEVASYLTSHEEDVSADGHPRSWSTEEMSDCGNRQYAKWGGVGDGRALDWAQSHANEVAEARGEELPPPNRQVRATRAPTPPEYTHDDMLEAKEQAETEGIDAGAIHAHGEGDSREFMPGATHVSLVAHLRETGEMPTDEENTMTDKTDRNLDDPEFSEGDPVQWSSQDTPVHGRVADVGDEFEPAPDVTITGDEGEAVYLIHELDDSLSPPQFRRENVAKPESSLSESQMDMPPASDENFADSENSMTEHRQQRTGAPRDDGGDDGKDGRYAGTANGDDGGDVPRRVRR
jgi:hypothetical protein